MMGEQDLDRSITVSVVVPVYRGEQTLAPLVTEIARLIEPRTSSEGHRFRVSEVVLVWDCGPDRSDEVIRDLATAHDWVRPVWLSRNYGQHAATLAGMASSAGDWVVTLDEDGQHNPEDIGGLLDTALRERAQVVYGAPSNPPPHGAIRNLASRATKAIWFKLLSDDAPRSFHSYRLVLGEVARSIAAYAGPGVFLDVALSWVIARSAEHSVVVREEGRAATSYSYRRLASHFWRLVITSGVRPLRLVTALGFVVATSGFALSAWIVFRRVTADVAVPGFASVIVTILVIGGTILFSLGVIAEYVGAAVRSAMGRPLYVTVHDPRDSFPDASANSSS